MKVICISFVLALCIQTAISGDDDWVTLPDMFEGDDIALTEEKERQIMNDTGIKMAADDDWISWAGKFEGDIALTEEQERQILNGTERNAISFSRTWTGGVIPYVFSSGFSDSEKNTINAAVKEYAAKTCITVKPRTSEPNYISIIPGSGCWSYVGRTGGMQQISLGRGCVYTGTILHEFMHAAGFFHEQSRSDRDSYVRINYQNIISGRESNFNKYLPGTLYAAYDLLSIMHYSSTAFSRNGLPTIEALDGTTRLGNRAGFTDLDVEKLNKLYRCSSTTATTTPPTATTTPPTTTAAPTTTTPVACTDVFGSANCGTWSRYCRRGRYRFFMRDACPETCGYCGCNDKHPRVCKSFAEDGVCEMAPYRSWMMTYCASSCGAC